ncbi:MAG: tyrosinase family protein [Bacteroidetes bacterium]|jgi:tyrosinase|nr:tyrosinase family protein [Bacteroidota bacterium]
MPTFTRKNAWNQNGTLDNPDLLWYAKALQVMQARPIADPTSWWFYAAIHGEYLLPGNTLPKPGPGQPDYRYLNWVNIKYIPVGAHLSTVPKKKLTDLFWDQCQHATWYFTPWHRGYLVALENLIRKIIVGLNGPADWALPYWNYMNQANSGAQSDIPPAFTEQHLPDGSANPLLVAERYGSGVTVGNGRRQANDECQWDTIYTEGANPGAAGPGDLTGYYYGGGETGFNHAGGEETGDLESNPHNAVHGMVGGNNKAKQAGLMGVPNTAALDPIFYLHHANIDRMWAAWNETGKNPNPTDANWQTGPAAHGNSRFAMPLDVNGTAWYYKPKDVSTTIGLAYNGTTYAYTYDDLALASFDTKQPARPLMNLAARLTRLNIAGDVKNIKMANKKERELVGASQGSITLKSNETNANVQLKTAAWKSVSNSLLQASVTNIPDEVFLQLEGVKGGNDVNFLSVYVNDEFVKSVSLFGLLNASMQQGASSGQGLTFKFNITNIVDNLHLSHNIDINSLNVKIKVEDELPGEEQITIDRVSVYRVSQ